MGIVVPFVRRRRLRCRRLRRRTHPFWLLHQHGTTDWIHNSYKHSTPPGNFFTQDPGPRSKVKVKDCKISC